MSSLFHIGGWVFFILAVKSFLGIGASGSDLDFSLLGVLLPIPDFKTLLYAGLAAFLGFLAHSFSKDGEPRRGTRLMICAALCAVLTFTPVANISAFSTMFAYQKEQRTADGYESIPEKDYKLYAFLGSGDSKPSDVDVMEYIMNGYDGHARDTYKTYKISGWLYPEEGVYFSDAEVTFRLVDKEGNDILRDGEPVILRYVESDKNCQPEGSGGIQTNTVKAKDLSGTPYGFIVEDVKKGYYIDLNDGSKHDLPLYY